MVMSLTAEVIDSGSSSYHENRRYVRRWIGQKRPYCRQKLPWKQWARTVASLAAWSIMEREKKKKRGFLGNSTRHLWKTRSLNSELSSIKRETGVAVNAGAKGERLHVKGIETVVRGLIQNRNDGKKRFKERKTVTQPSRHDD